MHRSVIKVVSRSPIPPKSFMETDILLNLARSHESQHAAFSPLFVECVKAIA